MKKLVFVIQLIFLYRLVLNQLHKRFKERGAWQGQCYVFPLIPAALPFRHPQW